MGDVRPLRIESSVPLAFPAWEDTAAYVDATLTSAKAVTRAREIHDSLRTDWTRRELHAIRVYMRPASRDEALEHSFGDHESGWIECPRTATGAFPMWKVEPR